MMERTVGDFALRPYGNQQGRYYIYIMLTGRFLNHRYCTELPIPDEPIQSIENMSCQRGHGYNFTYCYSTDILDYDTDDDTIYAPSNHEDDDEYPSIHHYDIIESDISCVYGNINN